MDPDSSVGGQQGGNPVLTRCLLLYLLAVAGLLLFVAAAPGCTHRCAPVFVLKDAVLLP